MLLNVSHDTVFQILALVPASSTSSVSSAYEGIEAVARWLAVASVFGALFYFWYSLKTGRGFGARFKKLNNERQIRLLETISFGVRTNLSLVEVQNKKFLVLVSPYGVQIRPVDPSGSFEEVLDTKASFEKVLDEVKK